MQVNFLTVLISIISIIVSVVIISLVTGQIQWIEALEIAGETRISLWGGSLCRVRVQSNETSFPSRMKLPRDMTLQHKSRHDLVDLKSRSTKGSLYAT